MQSTTLHLTEAETLQWLSLSENLQTTVKVVIETVDCYETDEEMSVRFALSPFAKDPTMRTLAENMRKGEVPGDSWTDAYSLEELAFVAGARGMTLIISGLLRSAETADDIAYLVTASELRHTLLQINANIEFLPSIQS